MLEGQRVPDDSNYRRLLVFEFWHKTRNAPEPKSAGQRSRLDRRTKAGKGNAARQPAGF